MAALHLRFDWQTWALLVSVGSSVWWPLCLYVWAYHGQLYGVSMIAGTVLLQKVTIPDKYVQSAVTSLHKQITTTYMAPPPPIGTRPEVILLFPHGLLSLEALAVYIHWTSQNHFKSTVFVDKKLDYACPGACMVFKMFGLSTDLSNHRSIDKKMQGQQTVAALPGGFVEAVGGTDETQVLYLGTVAYWLKQCKKHGYSLRIFHVYNGSDFVQQSAMGLETRIMIADRFHLPIILPSSINHVDSLFTRCLYYEHAHLPTTTEIQADLTRYIALDRLSPLFRSRMRKYHMIPTRLSRL
jgi:hypothetical protein